jgi:hypothetical protein
VEPTDRARTRWESAVGHARRALEDGARIVRVPAVDWRTLPADLAEMPVTPHARYLATRPSTHSIHRLTHRQMDGLPSVAILLSHVRAWDALLASGAPGGLILEDDACIDGVDPFRAVWQTIVVPRFAAVAAAADAAGDWECLVLGHFAVRSPRVYHRVGPAAHRLMTVESFFGSHAYALTRRGAEILRANALPINEQSDGLLLTLQQTGTLRLYLTPVSVVSQCMDKVDRGASPGETHTHIIATDTGARLRCYQVAFWPLLCVAAALLYRTLTHACPGNRSKTVP